MKNPIVITILVAVIVGALAFFGGMKYQQMQRGGGRNGQFQAGNFGGGNSGPRGSGAPGQRGAGFRPVLGEIISADDKSITVKMDDGSTKIVLVSDTTAINKTNPGTKSDLSIGTKVGVFGADNNGTVTAQNIQINPMQMRINDGNASPTASPK